MIGISGSVIWSKSLMELIFNLCGEFRWSSEGPVSQIHYPHLQIGAPGIFSDLLKSVQMLKREWGTESNGKLPHLFIPSKTAALVPEFTVEDLPSAQFQPWFLFLQWKPCLVQNTLIYIYIYIYIYKILSSQGQVIHRKLGILHSTLFSTFLFISPYGLFIMMLSIIWFLLVTRTFFPFTIPPRASFSSQFLLSQWPRQFLFLFFISSSVILPSPHSVVLSKSLRITTLHSTQSTSLASFLVLLPRIRRKCFSSC